MHLFCGLVELVTSPLTGPTIHRDPFLQQAFITISRLEPWVRHAIVSARRTRMNIQAHLPSITAQQDMLAVYHHALTSLWSLNHAALELHSIHDT